MKKKSIYCITKCKQMKNYIYLKIIFLSLIITVFSACIPDIFTEDDYGTVAGVVTDLNNNPIGNVKVSVYDIAVYSDNKGLFNIEKVKTGENILLEFSKNQYSSTQKVVNIKVNKKTFVYASIGKWAKVSQIDPSKDNSIDFQNANVKLPANGIVDEDGNSFTGSVTVKASYFDPTADNYDKVFPGDFKGENASGNIISIESFGFINVELKSGDKILNLASGKTADISIPIPDAYKNNAPNTIPLWYFDIETGIWKEEGSASNVNGYYVGKVSHFSSWNCDIGFPVATLKGRVVCEDGTPIKNALVIAKGFDSSWTNRERTADDGTFKIDVKADAVANVYAWSVTGTGELDQKSQTIHTNTPGAGDMKMIDDLVIDCDTTNKQYSRLYDINLDLIFVPVAVGETGKIIYLDINTGVWIPLSAGTTQDLYSIAVSSTKNIWVVGSNGTVLHSTDLQNWILTGISTDAHLYNVEFYNGYYGWIMGTTGKIFKTVDGGENWSVQVSGTVQTLYDASFVSKDKGWICGSKGTILFTDDGGNNWIYQNSTTVEDLKGIRFITGQKGWAVGDNGKIIRTNDGGQTWINQNVPGVLEDLNDIDFAHPDGGIIVGGNGTVLKTIDGGNTWQNESVVLKNNLEAVDINDIGKGVVVGDDNTFNIDVGKHSVSTGWTSQNSNVSDTLRCIKAVSETEAWIVGNSGAVLHTVNAGFDWNNISTGENQDFYSLEINGSDIWIGGKDNILLRSTDNGNSWQRLQYSSGGKTITKIQFLDQNRGWILLKVIYDLYYTGDYDQNEILFTTDGGVTWSHYNSLPGGDIHYYPDFIFADQNLGFVVDYDKVNDISCIYKTVDGGNSWSTECYDNIGADEGNAKICSLNGNLFWLGSGISLYHLENGKEWYGIVSGIGSVSNIEFINEQTGWWSGGDLKQTYDGGKSWFTQGDNLGYLRGIQYFDMVNINVGWAVGNDGKIYYTTSGGK